MTKETITRIKLTAGDGMILTDGESFGKVVFLASGDEGERWYEISEGEYRGIMREAEQVENSII